MSDIERNSVLTGNKDVSVKSGSRLPALTGKHRQYLQAATSDNTRKTYRSAIRHFEKWGGKLPSDRDTITHYLIDHAETLNPRTLEVRLTAISQWHQFQGFQDPAQDPGVRKTLKGIRRTHGKPKKKAQALRLQDLAAMIKHITQLPVSAKSTRDKALLLVGYFGGFRRSELVSINIEHLKWEAEGVIVTLPRSKTDQEGEGIRRAIPYGNDLICPVRSLKEWVEKADIKTGPVFRAINRWGQIQYRALNPASINEILKEIGTACNFGFIIDLSSHSLRRGLTTSAARENVDFETIKKQGGWKSDATVWEYIDEGRLFSNNVGHSLIDSITQFMK